MKISIITTLYKSEIHVHEFYNRILKVVSGYNLVYEIIFVNDGSPDNSLSLALELHKSDDNVIVINLSRNFGHHQAIMAGLHYCTGDYVFLIDSDLEEEPEILSIYFDLMKSSNGKYDVIYGVQPMRKGGFSERFLGRVFYNILKYVADFDYPSDTLTARLMKLDYVKSIIKYPEKGLDIWGVFVLAGYNQKSVVIEKSSKSETSYTFKKKWSMALEIITSVSSKPLHMIFYIGVFIFLISIFFAVIIVFKYFLEDMSQAIGWASLIASIWLIGGLTILLLGIISIYISKLFLETKNRPLYIIKNIFKN